MAKQKVEDEAKLDERTLNYVQDCLRQLRDPRLSHRAHREHKEAVGQEEACQPCRELITKLTEYEDLDKQGLLLKLPCKVGDTVYAYCSEFGILPYTVDCIVIDEKITYQCSSYSEPIGDCPSECLDEIEPDISDFGKTAFLKQAEAEEDLKRVKRKE